ncbi:MAG: HU family DNA-binding protein [Desulfobacteraceae bacterium]|nr:HU family DNA-binding protein [Desulfobacteraceae bacterium]
MTLTKEAIVDSIQNHLGFPKKEANELVEYTLHLNPQTGEDLPLRARRVVTFRCSTALREKINRNPKKKGKKK